MAATATASSVHYAPEDPSLPKPWRGLVDGKTGYVYFWNPETNVTQYERPASSSHVEPAEPRKSLSSSVHVQKASQGQCGDRSSNDNDDRYDRFGDAGSTKPSFAAETYQAVRSGSRHPHRVSNGTVDDGTTKGNHSSSTGTGLSPEAYRRRHEITVTGDNVPPPLTSFDSTRFPYEILREVYNAGFSAPTPIQAQSWPIALQGRDIVAIAKTGSGKTLGYLIPGFIHLKRKHNNPQLGPTVLVLSPTRELATQIQDEAIKFGKSSRISCTCLYGGAPKGPQLREVERGVNVVVATPGRLNDILEMKRIRLDQVSYLVLDEADRMLDMGFEPQIRKIVKEVPTRRQTLMYTATWPKEVRKIAADLLVNPVQVNIGNVDELVANKSITQYVEHVSPTEKHRRLEQILRSQEPGSKIIIFCTTKKMCDQLARSLSRQFGAAAIHGDKSQSDRDYVLNQFRNGRTPVLVATDVAARGLDIKDIRVVINYDFPTGIEDYVHRIGRTGRAGATGVAYTFLGDQDTKFASDLVKVLEGANQRVPVEIRDMASRASGIGRSRRQWGSGFSGRDNGHRGRNSDCKDGERNRWMFSSSDRGGRGCDRNMQHRFHDVDGPGYSRNYPETVTLPPEKRNRSSSPSRSRSLDKRSAWSDRRSRGHSRSRSADRFDKSIAIRGHPIGRSFHESVMPQGHSPPNGNQHLSSFIDAKSRAYQRLQSPPDSNHLDSGRSPCPPDSNHQDLGRSQSKQQEFQVGGSRSHLGDEEEEEGMIPAEDSTM